MKRFRNSRTARYSLRFIYATVVIALFADFIANEKPLVVKYQDEVRFPIFRSYFVNLGISEWPAELQNVDWKEMEHQWAIHPPIPYSPTNMDPKNTHATGPFEPQNVPSLHQRHWLGTDELGRDIFSGLIHGTRIALIVGILAMGIASVIGLFLGALAGYFGDSRAKIPVGTLLFALIGVFFGIFYGFGTRAYILEEAAGASNLLFLWELFLSFLILSMVMGMAYLVGQGASKLPFLRRNVSIPVDILIMRAVEVMVSIPTIFLIISLMALVKKPSLFLVISVIGLTRWTEITRLVRGELLRIRSLEYIEAARSLGFSEARVILKHALPNALSPVLTAISFGIASSILIESTLSFLGLTPADLVTWGGILSMARQDPASWWVALFPGMGIFLMVTAYNLIGDALTDAFKGKTS